MSKIDELKDKFHCQAISYVDMIWLFEKIEKLEVKLMQQSNRIVGLKEQLRLANIDCFNTEAKLKLQIHNATKQRAIANEAIDKWSKVRDKLKLAEGAIEDFEDIMNGSKGVDQLHLSSGVITWHHIVEAKWLERYAKYKQLRKA